MRFKLLILSVALAFLVTFVMAEEKPGKMSFNKPTVIGQVLDMDINNIDLPLNNDGSSGEDGRGYYPNGTTLSFLFQGGFAATAYVDGVLHASWMAKASLIEEYQPGIWGMDPDDGQARFYVVEKTDDFGSPAYNDWAGAVELGADYVELNGVDGYQPDGDRPDVLGDKTLWCVYNDGTPSSQRTPRLGTLPIGLEIQQTAFAFARADALGDVIFFRYRFLNVREDQKDINDLIFSVWTDPDLGDHLDDLIGCDTTLSLGFIYNDGSDLNYGPNPPAFGVDFFQGPIVETGVPSDTAFLYRGPFFGIDTLPEWINLPMTSYMYYIQSDPILGDPDDPEIARNYQEGGLDKLGAPIDPTVWGIGGTAETDSSYFYSGDPVAGTGWLDNTPADKRFMVNTGPFELAYGDTQDVVVAYIIAQGSSPLNSVTKLKETDEIAQLAYNANFFVAGPPPPPDVTVRTFDKKIEFVIDLSANGTYDYDQSDELFNRQVFEGVKIYQLASPSTSEMENGQLNRRLIFSYDIDNEYTDIYQSSGFSVEKIYTGNNNIDTTSIVDDGAAILKFTVEKDAFNQDAPLVNNVEYYFSVTAFSINRPFLTDLGGGSWQGGSGVFLENNLGGRNSYRVIPGRDENAPFLGTGATYTGERSPIYENEEYADLVGTVLIDVVDRQALTGDDYSVTFFNDGTLWQVTNDTRNETVRDSLVFQDIEGDQWSFPIIDGLSIRVHNVHDSLSTAELVLADTTDTTSTVWLEGNPGANYSAKAVFDGGVDYVKFAKSSLSTIKKRQYFPIEIEFDVTAVSNGYWYVGPNFNVFREARPIPVRAFDISDPNNKRQVNICYRTSSPVNGDLNFNNNDVFIMTSDYQESGAYDAAPDSLFRSEAYVTLNLRTVADSIAAPFSSKMIMTVIPNFVNSDADKFSFSTEEISPSLTQDERQTQLDRVKVVPNPYWAYSTYETSYDTPVLKFTHLDREVTIRIFDLAGRLVKTLHKNDESNEISWDLRNESDLKVGSGMYFAHVEVPGVGSKILKFAIVQREERIDRF